MLRYAFAGIAWLFLISVVIQVFLAGVGLLGGGTMEGHIGFGYLLPMIAILLVPIAWGAQPGRRTFRLSLLLLALMLVQPTLPYFREATPFVAALHPVNALVIFWLAVTLARRSTALIRQPLPAAEPAEGAVPQEA